MRGTPQRLRRTCWAQGSVAIIEKPLSWDWLPHHHGGLDGAKAARAEDEHVWLELWAVHEVYHLH